MLKIAFYLIENINSMEKQVFIKHKILATTNDKTQKILDVVNSLLSSRDQTKIICDLTIGKNEAEVIAWINCNKTTQDIKILSSQANKATYNYKIEVSLAHIKNAIKVIEEYEINSTLFCDNAKIILNDNDGDFIIYNKLFYK